MGMGGDEYLRLCRIDDGTKLGLGHLRFAGLGADREDRARGNGLDEIGTPA